MPASVWKATVRSQVSTAIRRSHSCCWAVPERANAFPRAITWAWSMEARLFSARKNQRYTSGSLPRLPMSTPVTSSGWGRLMPSRPPPTVVVG